MWRILFRAIPTPLWLSCRHGITYSNARTPALSDSFPGLLALVTGGSPISHGLFYDVSYDRTIFDPTKLPRVRDSHGNCVPLFPHNQHHLRSGQVRWRAYSVGGQAFRLRS